MSAGRSEAYHHHQAFVPAALDQSVRYNVKGAMLMVQFLRHAGAPDLRRISLAPSVLSRRRGGATGLSSF